MSKLSRLAAMPLMTIVALAAISMIVAPTDSAASWTDIPEGEVEDRGEMWGYKVNFVYAYDSAAGNQAQTIEWDFGDGSRSTEWTTSHTYATTGTYLVVQHVTNSYNGFSEDWGYYRIHVMGHPYVEIVMPDGAPAAERVYTTKGHPAAEPSDPVWEGHRLVGYYADPECTVPFDWDQLLDAAVVAYPKFVEVGGGHGEDQDGGEDGTGPIRIDGTIAAVVIATIIAAIIAAITKHPAAIIVAIALAAISVIGALGYLSMPEVIPGFKAVRI